MPDLIFRSELIAQLQGFKLSLGDIVLGFVVDRVIDRVREMPAFPLCNELKSLPQLGWISVTERLPEADGSYIVCTTTGTVTTARFYSAKVFPPTHYRPSAHSLDATWQSNRNITHWMPLPKAPEAAHENL